MIDVDLIFVPVVKQFERHLGVATANYQNVISVFNSLFDETFKILVWLVPIVRSWIFLVPQLPVICFSVLRHCFEYIYISDS